MGVIIEMQISREAVLYQAKMQTYYVGDARKDDKLMDFASKLQASDANDDVLNKFVDTAASEIVDVLSALLERVVLESRSEVKEGNPVTVYEYSLDVPLTFDGNQTNVIHEGIMDFIINWTIYEWLSLVFPELSKIFYEKCDMVKGKLRHRINMRVKPVRRAIPPI